MGWPWSIDLCVPLIVNRPFDAASTVGIDTIPTRSTESKTMPKINFNIRSSKLGYL